ncbi:hypothetical protein [Pseudarthrobacter sp. H2]|uniref:hypothetical protein n=1 Tax=Pseudarthrobacter sp. H2 TaxID=3418415 RepID=UPI003CE8F461
MSDEPEAADESLTEEELIQQFVMWVEFMIHDTESISDAWGPAPTPGYWCPQW